MPVDFSVKLPPIKGQLICSGRGIGLALAFSWDCNSLVTLADADVEFQLSVGLTCFKSAFSKDRTRLSTWYSKVKRIAKRRELCNREKPHYDYSLFAGEDLSGF